MTQKSIREMRRHVVMFQAGDCEGVEARKMKPTLDHRPAMWENILGTVYAMNAAGEIKYFDYKWQEALDFSGALAEGADPRWAKMTRDRMYQEISGSKGLRVGRSALWVIR